MLGGYDNDPRAPWNEVEPRMRTCTACNGMGYYYYALDINTGCTIETTQMAYSILPDNEVEAMSGGYRHCKFDIEKCEVCDGEGEVVDDFEPDYEDDYE